MQFTGMAVDGAAVAAVGPATLAVRYAIPGEQAQVEVVRTNPAPLGRIIALQRRSPDAAAPPCPHFGRCGGCQWQHITPEGQRRFKTAMVVEALKTAGVREGQVGACAGGTAWAYRNVLRAAFDRRGEALLAGFFGWGEQRLYNIETCPVQHPTNVRILDVVRDAARTLGLPPYDWGRRSGIVRGVLAISAYATGQALAVLSTAVPLPDRMAFVRAVLDRVPGLVGLLQTVRAGQGTAFFGPALTLLWGRRYIEDEILGLRLRLEPRRALPPNPATLPLLLEAVARAGDLREGDQVFDAFAEIGLLPLALAQRVRRAVGVVTDSETMKEAWAAAARNGIANAVFYTRDPAKVLAKLHQRGERSDVLLAGPPGEGLPEALVEAIVAAGPRRLVYIGRSLAVTGRDLVRLRRAGYAVTAVQPVDLAPQTSHVHTVVALRPA